MQNIALFQMFSDFVVAYSSDGVVWPLGLEFSKIFSVINFRGV